MIQSKKRESKEGIFPTIALTLTDQSIELGFPCKMIAMRDRDKDLEIKISI